MKRKKQGTWFNIMLKIYPNRLDAPIKRVGTNDSNDPGISAISNDYYSVRFYAGTFQEKSFFVETQKGD